VQAANQFETSQPKFDLELIERCLGEVRLEDAIWNSFFTRSAIEPLRIEYEEFCRDYEGTLRGVLAFLKIRLPARGKIGIPSTIRQGDELSQKWEERYSLLRQISPLAVHP
jgi:LPS sulfotransferase NodH